MISKPRVFGIWLVIKLCVVAALSFATASCDSRSGRVKVSFSPSDDKRAAFIELAKTSKYVDLGEVGMKDGKADVLPIPKKDIPTYISSHDKIIVIRWLTREEYQALLGGREK